MAKYKDPLTGKVTKYAYTEQGEAAYKRRTKKAKIQKKTTNKKRK